MKPSALRGTLTAVQHVTVGPARLPVLDSGAGPVLVALHAGVADHRVWEACQTQWTADRWRVISYDRRGFGQSSWQPERFSHVDDLFAVLDTCEVDQAVLVGNSQGGRIAIEAALRAPGRVSGLLLIAPAITGAPELDTAAFGPQLAMLDQELDHADEAGDLPLVNELEAHLWLDGPEQPQGRVRGPARELFLDMNGQVLAAADVGEDIWDPSAWDRLNRLSAPTLVITGAYDVAQTNQRVVEATARIPHASHVQIQTAHLPMLEDPASFLTVVTPFLNEQR